MIMVTASFTGLLKILFYIILAYYAIKFLLRLFAPMIMQQVVKKAEQNFNQRQQSYQNTQQPYQNTTQQPVKEKKKVGEYIDYEEIE